MPYTSFGEYEEQNHGARICKVSSHRGMADSRDLAATRASPGRRPLGADWPADRAIGAGVIHLVALSGKATIYGSIVASTKAATVGQPLLLAWTTSAGAVCSAKSSSTNAGWTASKPSFTGTVPASGEQILTETVGGTVTYTLTCTAPGAAPVKLSTSVFWSWRPVTATISASPAPITAGEAVTATSGVRLPHEEGSDDPLAA